MNDLRTDATVQAETLASLSEAMSRHSGADPNGIELIFAGAALANYLVVREGELYHCVPCGAITAKHFDTAGHKAFCPIRRWFAAVESTWRSPNV